MSKLSVFWHKKTDIFQAVVAYLEDAASNINGEDKAKIVTDLMKALHIAEGGVWGGLFKSAVLAAIDYELAVLRRHARPEIPVVGLPTPPVVVVPYDTEFPAPLPSDADLLKEGFKPGDWKWEKKDKSAWLVGHAGGILNADVYDQVGSIVEV